MEIISQLILLLSLVFIVQATEDPHFFIRQKCGDEFGLTDENLREAKKDPKDMGCYLYCFFKELSIMDGQGELYPDNAVNAVEESLREAAEPLISACYEIGKKLPIDKPCSRAHALVDCFMSRAPSLYDQLGLFQAPHDGQ